MKNHVVLLPQTPWAGPAAFQVSGCEIDLHQGRVAESPESSLIYELRVDEKASNPDSFPPLDLHDCGDGHLLMSEKMISCLNSLGVDNIQLFPAEVTCVNSGNKLKYQTANIIGLISALDTEKSECEIDEDGFVEAFYTLAIDEDKAKNLDLFRLYESFHTIIISERIANALQQAKLTGFLVLAQEDWMPGML